MKRLLLGALLLLGLIPQARAQDAQVISSCGSPPTTLLAGSVTPLFVDITGKLCSNAAGGGGSPGGLSGAVQFNSSGSFGGITGVTTNGTNLTISSTLIYSGAAVGTQVACLGLDASNNVVKNAAACGAGGGGTPGGSNTQLQFNNAGSFGGIAGATTNGTVVTFATNDLSLAGATSGNTLLNATAAAGAGTVATFPANTGIVAELNLAQTFSAVQTFSASNGIVYSGAAVGTQVSCLGLDASNNVVKNAAACGSGGGGTPGGANTNVQFNNSGAFGGDAGFTYTTLGQVTIAGGTITTNNKALTITQTWNLGTTVFDAPAVINVTNTLSDVSSRLFDVQGGGTSLFSVMQQASGGALARAIVVVPALSTITTSTNNGQFFIGTGMTLTGSNAAATSLGGSRYLGFGAAFNIGGGINTNYYYGGNTTDIPTNLGVTVTVYADDSAVSNRSTLAIANSTTASGLRVYNTTDSMGGAPTNFERGVFDWTTNAGVLTIGTQKGGTGSNRGIFYSTTVTESGGTSPHIFYASGLGSWSAGIGPNHFIIPRAAFFGFATASGSTPDYTGADLGFGRVAAGLLDIDDGQTLGAVAQLRINGQTIASLPGGTPPACNATYLGARATVNNSSQTLTAAIGAVLSTTTGTNIVPVFCDGTNWRIG